MTAIFVLLIIGVVIWAIYEMARKESEATKTASGRKKGFSYEDFRKREDFDDALALLQKAGKAGFADESDRLTRWVEEKGGVSRMLEFREFVLLKYLLLSGIRDALVNKHAAVLSRKRKQSLFLDDYGHHVRNKWDAETAYFIDKVLVPEMLRAWSSFADPSDSDAASWFADVLNQTPEGYKEFREAIDEALDEYDSLHAASGSSYDESMTGELYERYVAILIGQAGWTYRLTPSTGDHGVDVIAEYNGTRVAVQCKKSVSSVGNTAVQEVFSGAGFHDCTAGCVVSNAGFTGAARQAAEKLGVDLLHHDQITDYFKRMREEVERETGGRQHATSSDESARHLRDPFAVLGLSQTASVDEIERAFRQKVPLYHPDKVATMGKEVQQEAARRMAEINWARGECLRRAATR